MRFITEAVWGRAAPSSLPTRKAPSRDSLVAPSPHDDGSSIQRWSHYDDAAPSLHGAWATCFNVFPLPNVRRALRYLSEKSGNKTATLFRRGGERSDARNTLRALLRMENTRTGIRQTRRFAGEGRASRCGRGREETRGLLNVAPSPSSLPILPYDQEILDAGEHDLRGDGGEEEARELGKHREAGLAEDALYVVRHQ